MSDVWSRSSMGSAIGNRIARYPQVILFRSTPIRTRSTVLKHLSATCSTTGAERLHLSGHLRQIADEIKDQPHGLAAMVGRWRGRARYPRYIVSILRE